MASRAKSASSATSTRSNNVTVNQRNVKSSYERTSKYEKPSDRVNPKTINPFEKKQSKSVFASSYQKGAIPCRLVHGSVKHKLQWTTPPEELNFDPLLAIMAEGLKETVHPYSFVASKGFMELLMVEDADIKTLPVLQKLVAPMKTALASPDDKCFASSLEALVLLSDTVQASLVAHLKHLLPEIARKMMKKTHKDKITSALNKIERNSGPEATGIIKARIPTYMSVL